MAFFNSKYTTQSPALTVNSCTARSTKKLHGKGLKLAVPVNDVANWLITTDSVFNVPLTHSS